MAHAIVGKGANRANTEASSVVAKVQGGIQGMNRVFHATNRKGKVDFGATRNFPSLADTVPDLTKCCTGDPPINGIGNLPGDLRQTKTGVQNCVQASPSIDNGCGVNRFAIWTGDAVTV